ncbi:MAG: hypothetical protein HQK87_11595 [Nitrospinae bacterium]|nr:hypothetical protein [Nitrospinota bacterium]
MNLKGLFAATLVIAVAFGASPAFAEQYYFFVQNDTDSKITGLAASEDGNSWGKFDLGGGIGVGKKVKMVWDPSTGGQSCEQFLKASFADGSESESETFDFCSDMDDPIVFE